MRWRTKYCDTCTYCIKGVCRFLPPSILMRYNNKAFYPVVISHETDGDNSDTGTNKACSKYVPKKKRVKK